MPHQKGEDFRAHLPLSETVFHVLLSLCDADRHGYGILRDVEARTHGQVHIGTGTLYTAVRRLVERGLIDESDIRPDPSVDDERRRYYTLTNLGRRVVTAEATRLRTMVSLAESKKVLS